MPRGPVPGKARGSTYPGGEVGFWLEVFSKVLVSLEVPQVGLQRKRRQKEVSLLAQHALGMQHLLPQVPVIVVARRSVAGQGEREEGW